MTELRDRLEAQAHALGFDQVAIAAAGPADPQGHFQRWLDAGFHGSMGYMERRAAERIDPTRLVPDARSVVVLSTYYRHERPAGGTGARVSRYAWGRDYHRVIGKRLKKLRRWLVEEEPDATVYTEVDTGPILEKHWAQEAGLGWIGKHGNLINRRRSSWIFLSTLVTNLELPADTRHADRCGSCDRCIRACPTDAIISPAVVDSRRCISYHTIEHRAEIPEPLRMGHGEWIFGCDDCQEVCPWNKFATEAGDPAFTPRADQAEVDPEEVLALDEQGFLSRFAGTPLMRAGREGLARSAATVLGNRREPAAVPLLKRALETDPSTVVRTHAAWALGRIATAEALAALELQLQSDPPPPLHTAITTALRGRS